MINRIAAAGAVAGVAALGFLGSKFIGKTKINFVDQPEPVVEAPVVTPEPVEKETKALGVAEVRHIPAVLRAVVASKSMAADVVGQVIEEDANKREPLPAGYKITDLHGDRGVVVKVIDDNQMPEEGNPVNAEIILSQESIDKRLEDTTFWDSFLTRISPRGIIEVADAAELISRQKELNKGYTSVQLNNEIVGIVHVTKSGLNALIPQGDGQFRVVSNNKRFDGEAFVGLVKAKLFLNGRY